MLITRRHLTQLLGLLWLIDGVLQIQPQMWTMNMVNGVMKPMLEGQPGTIEGSLQWIVQVTTQHLVLVNLLITVIQVLIGIGLIFGKENSTLVKTTLITSIIWSIIVWYAGEGMSMLLTGQSSALSGAPGAVLLYALLALVVYPRASNTQSDAEGVLSRQQLLWSLAGFWLLAAALQLQPYWWQPGQISQEIGGLVGQGGVNTFIVDPVLQWFSTITANSEIPLNITLIAVFLALGIALLLVKSERIRAVLIASIVVSVLLWYIAQAFGMILTGMATDFNSGLLLVIIALACWPGKYGIVSESRSTPSETLYPLRSQSALAEPPRG